MAQTKVLFETVSVTEVRTTDVEGVGTMRYEEDKVYRWVQNDFGTDLIVGDVVFHTFSDTTTMDQNVSECLTANLAIMAGVAVSAIPTTEYGWIQVFGYNPTIAVNAYQALGPILVGDFLKGVNSEQYAVVDATTQPAYGRHIIAITAVASNTPTIATTIDGFIECL